MRRAETIRLILCSCCFALNLYSSVFDSFEARLPKLREATASVSEAAKFASKRIWENPSCAISIPYEESLGFREELIARSGGLAQIGRAYPRPGDIVLYAIRDWENSGNRPVWLADRWKAMGATVVAFASKNGAPADFSPDFFIDNGAPGGSGAHGSANSLANAVLGWMWCMEYASSFSREYGAFPAVTKGIISDSSWIINGANDAPDGQVRFRRSPVAIPEGELALCYLARARALVEEMKEPGIVSSVRKAAAVIASALEEGRRVGVAGLGHLILEEPKHGLKSPMIGFRAVSMVEESANSVLGEGDLLVWIAYMGMNSRWANYALPFENAGIEVLPCFAQPPVPEPVGKYPAYIPQLWSVPDAVVPIPVPPYLMGSISEINRVLLLHMIDEEVASELGRRGCAPTKGEFFDPTRFWLFGQQRNNLSWKFNSMPDDGDIVTVYNGNFEIIDGPKPYHCMPDKAVFLPVPAEKRVRKTGAGNGTSICSTNNLDWRFCGAGNKGEESVPYETLRPIRGTGRVITVKDGLFGIADEKGKTVLPPTYPLVREIGHGLALYADDTLKYGVLDLETGKVLSRASYDPCPAALSRDSVIASIGGKYGLFSPEGESILAPVYDEMTGAMHKNRVLARIGRFWGVFSALAGKPPVVPPLKYTSVKAIEGGYGVSIGRFHGELDLDGNEIIPPEYDVIKRNHALGERLLRKGGKWFLCRAQDAMREFMPGCTFLDFAIPYGLDKEQAGAFEPRYRFEKDGKWGYAASDGKTVFENRFSFAYPFDKNGFAQVATGGVWRIDRGVFPLLDKAKWGLASTNGNVVIPHLYDAVKTNGRHIEALKRSNDVYATP